MLFGGILVLSDTVEAFVIWTAAIATGLAALLAYVHALGWFDPRKITSVWAGIWRGTAVALVVFLLTNILTWAIASTFEPFFGRFIETVLRRTMYAVAFFGWLVSIIGALIGMVVALLVRRSNSSLQPTGHEQPAAE